MLMNGVRMNVDDACKRIQKIINAGYEQKTIISPHNYGALRMIFYPKDPEDKTRQPLEVFMCELTVNTYYELRSLNGYFNETIEGDVYKSIGYKSYY